MNKNEIFTLWITLNNEKELPILAHLSLKSMLLCGHEVILYTYSHLENIPKGVKVLDANEIIDKSKIFLSTEGHKTYSGFADLFRLHRLYKYGGTWLDLDVLLIRNINDKYDDDILICSEPTFRFYLHPNNGLLRFPQQDPFIKHMLHHAESADKNTTFGQNGPKLITETLKNFPDYNQYLKTFNIYHILGWKYLDDYSKTPEKLLNKLNMDEIIGFHINNTFFEKIFTTKNYKGLFELLKKSILNSNSPDEYNNYLNEYNILTPKNNDIVKAGDLKYLDVMDDILDISFEYSLLIDAKNLRKVEIYNILHSIGFGLQPEDILKDIQIIIFGKTNLGNDKIRFKDNITIITSDFKDIYPYIEDYIYGKHIIPLNKPIIFSTKFFKDKTVETDIESYIIEDNLSVNIINKKCFLELLYKYGAENIFNLPKDIIDDFDCEINKENLIVKYGFKSKEVCSLIEKIDNLNKLDGEDITLKFLKTKSEIKKLKFKNLIDEVSYNYYTSYLNIINSSTFHEYKLKEQNTQLECLNSFYLNKLNTKYKF